MQGTCHLPWPGLHPGGALAAPGGHNGSALHSTAMHTRLPAGLYHSGEEPLVGLSPSCLHKAFHYPTRHGLWSKAVRLTGTALLLPQRGTTAHTLMSNSSVSGNGADSREHAFLKPFLRKLRVFVISCRNFGNECGLSVFSCVQQKSPCRRSPRPFIHTQEKELIDFEVQCWHLLLFKTRTLATVIHHAFSIATRVRQMKASCCRMRNAK